MSEEPIKVLLIEDNPGDIRLIREMLAEAKGAIFHLECTDRLKTGLQRLAKGGIDVVLLDLALPESQGLDTFARAKAGAPGVPIVVLTALDDEILGIKAVQAGAQDYLVKGQVSVRPLSRSIRYGLERKRAEEALRKSKDLFEKTFSSQRDAIFVLDAKSPPTILECNPATTVIFGYTRQEMLGRTTAFLHIDETALKRFQGYLDPAIEKYGVLHLFNFKMKRKNGTVFPTEHSVAPLEDEKGRRIGWVSVVRDITERKRAEEALRESEERYRTLFETSADGILIADIETRKFKYANPAICKMLGYSEEELKTMGVDDIHPQEDLGYVISEFEAQARGEKTLTPDIPCLRKDGRVIYADINTTKVVIDGRECNLGFFRDITERRHLERQIVYLSGRARRRIGQDLHDGLGQRLTGIAFISKVLEQKLAAKSLAEAADAREIVKLVNQAIGETRRLARGLAPVDLSADGLMLALQEFAANVEDMFNISCIFKCEKPVLIKDHFAALNLYRIAEEAVDNAIKHGKAKHILIGLSNVNDRTTLTVKDDGVGLPEGWEKSKGMGLNIMNYRTRQIGASFDVKRNVGGGTIVTCSFQNISDKK